MTKKLNWKLKQLPTASEVAELVDKKVITATEAKDMLFSEADDKDPTIAELKRQIEFLEGLVKELSKRESTHTTYVTRYIQEWTPRLPDVVWCSTSITGSLTTGSTISAANYTAGLLN